jgi:hypothetical protein
LPFVSQTNNFDLLSKIFSLPCYLHYIMALEGTVLKARFIITLFKNIKPLEFGVFIKPL